MILFRFLGGRKFFNHMSKKGLVSIILFFLPFVSGLYLLLNSQWDIVLRGLLLIVATIIFFVFIFPLEKFIVKKLSFKTLSYLTPIIYFILVVASITLSWKLINSNASGNFWIFLFAFSCCYVPYNYMLQGEQAKSGKAGILTNATNNYSVLGYLLFGILMNFTSIGILWSYSLLIVLGLILLNGLSSRIRSEIGAKLEN